MKFYHATTPEAVESILSNGILRADAFGEVFLCRTPLDACKFVVIRGVTLVSVLEINMKRSEVYESHDHSEEFFGCKAYAHRGDIRIQACIPVLTYDFTAVFKE